MAGIQHKPVGVFWDIENCSVPRTKSPSGIIAHIRNFFVFNRLNHREFEFIISCDVTRMRKDIPEDINKAGGVTLAHVNGNSKNAADEKLREIMKKFVDTHASSVSPVLILISGDIDFVNDLRGNQTRLGCTIILIHASNCSAQFRIGWNETYCFTSFCSAVKDNLAPNKQLAFPGPPNQKYQAGPPNQKYQAGPPNRKSEGGPPNQKNPPEERFKQNDPKVQPQAQPAYKIERTQRPAQVQKEKNARAPNTMINGQHAPPPPPLPSQHQGQQFGQGNRNKAFNNGPNVNQQASQQHVNSNGANNPNMRYTSNGGNNNPTQTNDVRTNDDAEKTAKNKFILMVGGLPGKMDFKILKENLQLQANKVQGKVKYVKNGQAFITFRNKSNADRAVELFNGKKVFGKTLNVSFTKNIPFEDQADGKPKPGSEGFVMVEQADGSTGGSKKSKKKDVNSGSSLSNGGLSADPVLAGLGSFIGGLVANRIAATTPGNKSPESCPIQ